jgi:hypothetical protein
VADQKMIERLVNLIERQIALDLHFKGVTQGAIAKVLQKNKSWVNSLLRGMPKGNGHE